MYPHTNFKLSHGETISISDLNEIVIDQVQIPLDITNQVSRGRIPDGNGNWCYFRKSFSKCLKRSEYLLYRIYW